MDKFIIRIGSVGYYTGRIIKAPKKFGNVFFADFTKDPQNSKQYTSYGVALMGMKSILNKCDMPTCVVKRLSECEAITE